MSASKGLAANRHEVRKAKREATMTATGAALPHPAGDAALAGVLTRVFLAVSKAGVFAPVKQDSAS
jgi:hypothetical protein